MIKDLSENELDKPGIKVVTFKKERKTTMMDYITGISKQFATSKAASALGLPESVINDINDKDLVPMYLYK